MGLDWIKADAIFYPTVFSNYFLWGLAIYYLILGVMSGSLGQIILCGIGILYFAKLMTFITGSSTRDLGIHARNEAVEEFNDFIERHKKFEKIEEKETESKQYECDLCGRKISKEQYERNDGRCPTCVAEDTHVTMFDGEGEAY